MTDPGWLYIAVSDAYPCKLKIGLTRRPVSIRAGELNASRYCLPGHEHGGNWCMVYAQPAPDCVAAERRAHGMLADRRVAWGREIFAVDLDQAKAVVDACAPHTGEGRGPLPRPQTVYTWKPRRRWSERRFWLWIKLAIAVAVIAVALLKPGIPYWLPGKLARAGYLIERLAR